MSLLRTLYPPRGASVRIRRLGWPKNIITAAYGGTPAAPNPNFCSTMNIGYAYNAANAFF